MTYRDALEGLFGLTRFGEKMDLSVPEALNDALGRPLDAYRSVIVGGTNGKGSTSAFLDGLLRAGGLRVGLFTSPHLISFRERVRVDGALIAEEAVAALTPRVLAAHRAPSFFEAVWALAALHFAEVGVDLVIWEVGLGGRLDATNACDPEAAGVASLGLDHTAVLGDTLTAIAREKAGIFRAGRPALTTCHGEALDALRAAWPAVDAVATRADLPPLPLPGAHQRRNASLACALAEALGVPVDVDALRTVSWPGRAERLGDVILDCAHNPPGAEALAAWLDEADLGPLHLIFGAMADKDVGPVAATLGPRAASVTLVTPDYPRRRAAAELRAAFPGADVAVIDAVPEALEARPRDRVTLVTGSCFLVGEARAWLTGQPFPELGLRTIAR